MAKQQKKAGLAFGITALTLFGIAAGGFVLAGYSARKRGWTRNQMISKSFKVPYVKPEYQDLEEQLENEMDPEEWLASFR